jgi:hypothetical protein
MEMPLPHTPAARSPCQAPPTPRGPQAWERASVESAAKKKKSSCISSKLGTHQSFFHSLPYSAE